MNVTLLGTGSAMPVPGRAQSGLLLERGGDRLLIDCGSGVLNRLSETDVGYEGVSTVLLTHHHLDHVADLMPLLKARWLAGEDSLAVLGPAGTESLVEGLLDVHDYLQGRVELEIREVDPEPFETAGFSVDAIETRHSMQCHAYRVSGSGGDVTISGDSEAFEGMARFADGSRALVHDCSFPDSVETENHPTPAQLGDALAGSNVERLYLTHLYPHTQGRHREMVASVERSFGGQVTVAEDRLSFEV